MLEAHQEGSDEWLREKVAKIHLHVLELCTQMHGVHLARGLLDATLDIQDLHERMRYLHDLFLDLTKPLATPFARIIARGALKFKPVDIRTFLLDPYFLDLDGQVYPKVLDELEEINSGKYIETVLTGGIGSAKTTCALWTTAYQIYLLSTLRSPQREFGLDETSEILFVFQTLNATKAKQLDYARFRALMERCEYFRKDFPFDRDLSSELRFPHRIIVRPVSGSDTATIGENVMGGVIDEVNFMAITENSKQSIDGGTYDQAQAMYNSIATRRKSRFMKAGKIYGMLCLVSSKRYPNQFTDRKEAEAKMQLAEKGSTNIYIYDKRTWEIKPEGHFGTEWFSIFIGDTSRKPRVLEDDEIAKFPEADKHLIMRIPMEHRWEFNNDMVTALRDVAGVSTLATVPYFTDTEAVADAIGRVPNIFLEDWVDFAGTKLHINLDHIKNLHEPRAVHLDLSRTGDSTGLAIGHLAGFKRMNRGDQFEYLPFIKIDGVVEIRPPKNGEILYYKIREVIYALKEMGLNVKWVTCDSYQSVDTLQVLHQKGYKCGEISMDTSIRPYMLTKSAITDGRLALPPHELLKLELVSLEFDAKANKVDHPDAGLCSSKDVADSVAGVVTCLTTRRELWVKHKIPLTQLPESVIAAEKTARVKDA